MDTQILQTQIDELKSRLDSMNKSSSINLDFENALRERIGNFTGLTGTSTTPVGTLQFIYNGTTYNILIA